MKITFFNRSPVPLIAWVVILTVFISGRAMAQLIPVSLEQRIDNSSAIFEGKVISKTSFWDASHTHIYTSNIIGVYKVFKGELTASQVEVITPGGIVGGDMEQVTHTLQLNEGDIGIFTSVPNTVRLASSSPLKRLKAYSGVQGFIKYDERNKTARDAFRTYKSISSDVYSAITRRTRVNYRVIRKADFKMQ